MESRKPREVTSLPLRDSTSVCCSAGYIDCLRDFLAIFDVNDEEDHSENNTDTPYYDVGNTQKRVLASEPRCGGDDEMLFAIKGSHRVGIVDVDCVVSSRQRLQECALVTDPTVKFAEVRQSSGPHPHDEIFIDVTVIVSVVGVQSPGIFVWPARWVGEATPAGWVVEFVLLVRQPSYTSVEQGDRLCGRTSIICQGKRVIEQTVGNGPTGCYR